MWHVRDVLTYSKYIVTEESEPSVAILPHPQPGSPSPLLPLYLFSIFHSSSCETRITYFFKFHLYKFRYTYVGRECSLANKRSRLLVYFFTHTSQSSNNCRSSLVPNGKQNKTKTRQLVSPGFCDCQVYNVKFELETKFGLIWRASPLKLTDRFLSLKFIWDSASSDWNCGMCCYLPHFCVSISRIHKNLDICSIGIASCFYFELFGCGIFDYFIVQIASIAICQFYESCARIHSR